MTDLYVSTLIVHWVWISMKLNLSFHFLKKMLYLCVFNTRHSQPHGLVSEHEMAPLLCMINWYKCRTKRLLSALVSQNYTRWTKISSCKPQWGQSVSGLRFVTKTSRIQSKCWPLDRDLPNNIIIMILKTDFSNTLGLYMVKTNRQVRSLT
jgi:hypothetical protein